MELPIEAIAQLGLGAIFLYLFVRKDGELKEKNQQVMDAFKDNTVASTQLKDVIRENTTLTQEIWKQLVKKDRR